MLSMPSGGEVNLSKGFTQALLSQGAMINGNGRRSNKLIASFLHELSLTEDCI